MLNVRVWNYGDYSSTNYGSCRAVTVGPLTLYYSYETVVAFRAKGFGFAISQNVWGTTTGKHLNWINKDKSKRIPNDVFQKKLNEVLENHRVEFCPPELVTRYNQLVAS